MTAGLVSLSPVQLDFVRVLPYNAFTQRPRVFRKMTRNISANATLGQVARVPSNVPDC